MSHSYRHEVSRNAYYRFGHTKTVGGGMIFYFWTILNDNSALKAIMDEGVLWPTKT